MQVNLLFGFLGSGKTTLARHLLQERGNVCKTALIVNEFGDVGVDGDILRGANVDMIELNSGCMCCTLRGSLLLAIEELRAKKKVGRIIVEATGVAQPGDLRETLSDRSFTLEYTLGPIVTVVDAAKFIKLQTMLGDFYTKQIEHADIVVLNKVDLASTQELREVEASVRELNSEACVLFAVQCDVDSQLILEGTVSNRLQAPWAGPSGFDANLETHPNPVEPARGRHADHAHGHLHDIESFVLDAGREYTRSGLLAFFGELGDDVWRAKGFMRVDGQSTLVQYCLGDVSIAAAPMPLNRSLVFIGRRMNRMGIETGFARAVARDVTAVESGG
jgi:G3E family GTPase